MPYKMGVEGIIGPKPPQIYEAPHGKRLAAGIAAGVGAAAGLAAGGVWFFHSEQAAPLRERANHLLEKFARRWPGNTNWSFHLPHMMLDNEVPEKFERNLRAYLSDGRHYAAQALEFTESAVGRMEIFPQSYEFKFTSEQPTYASPLVHKILGLTGLDLSGVNIPRDGRIPVKGVVEIRYGSRRFFPSFGNKRITYAVVGVEEQTFAQLKVDEKHGKEDHLPALKGKVIFIPIDIRHYREQSYRKFIPRSIRVRRLAVKKFEMTGDWMKEGD